MASIFGDLRVRYDPWEVDYGDQTPLVAIEQEPDEKIDLDVEHDRSSWRHIAPPGDSAPHRRVVFIDGVMRLESRIQARKDEQIIYGAFGSFAVGAVELQSSTAAFGTMRPFRTLVVGADLQLPEVVPVRPSLDYKVERTEKRDLNGPLRGLQGLMRLEEARLARESCREDTLVIVDGRLSFDAKRKEEALGYVKRIHKLYLPARLLPMLAALPERTRTPLFCIGATKDGFARHSWFQRLEAPSLGATELHGIVRLEVSGRVEVARARELADATTVWLPRVAPQRARDPRAPQNLLPIGALEQRLRIHLGNAQLHRRWIQTLIAQEARRA